MLVLLFAACFPRLEPPAADSAPTGDDSGTTPLIESRCGDGDDDDGDGDIDCDDADCIGSRACEDTDTDTPADPESDCDNGDDDDDDGDIDCADTDCADDPACDEPATCWDLDAGDELGFEIQSGTAAGNDGRGSCGTSSTADTFITWTAPSSDTFVFDTVGSSADTTLWVVAETCDGEELACNDNTFGSDSQVSVTLTRGDEIVIGVDAAGSWVLSAWPGDCPDFSIGSELAISGTTAPGSDYTSSLCGASPEAAVTFRWVAPSAGTWTFSTDGSDFDTILMLQQETCEGTELDCNDDHVDGSYGYSEASAYLAAGEVVAITLGGYDGDTGAYFLTITEG